MALDKIPRRELVFVFVSHILVVCCLLFFYHFDLISFSSIYFWIFVLLVGLGCLYRPHIAFYLFAGLVPFEAIDLSSDVIGLSLNPYQIVGSLLAVSIFVNLFLKREGFSLGKLPSVHLCDVGVALLLVGSVISTFLVSPDINASLKLTVILTHFALLYLVVRVFVRSTSDLTVPGVMFITSATVISVYAVIQNVLFEVGATTNAAMVARPNATFFEADWLGMFLIMSLLCTLVYYLFTYTRGSRTQHERCIGLILAFCFTIQLVAIILSVARSAWLGLVAGLVVGLLYLSLNRRWRSLKTCGTFLIGTFIGALLTVEIFGLSRFDLGDRAVSATSGLQEITIACKKSGACTSEFSCEVPEQIESTEELSLYGCKKINLEEIEKERDAGALVTTTQRPDPNVSIRKEIYVTSLEQIKNSPVLGIGWGSISKILGEDEQGTALNSSNIFLQIWLGAGLLGILGISLIIVSLLRHVWQSKYEYFYNFLILSLGAGLLVSNMFNAGLFMGFIWIYLATCQAKE